MDKNASEFVAKVTFKATSELASLVALVKDRAQSEEEYAHYKKAFKTILETAHSEILRKIFDEYPDIEKGFDECIADFGRLP